MAAYPPSSAAYPPSTGAYPPSSSGPSASVELHLSCKGLKKADLLSKSDPLVAVYRLSAGKKWEEVSELYYCTQASRLVNWRDAGCATNAS